ncbi:MAG: iron ABC transporter permease, partial [Actinomycetaceae bacterium]|nr:iron ABC transporter permease [Actinomycetaceae bacterium]
MRVKRSYARLLTFSILIVLLLISAILSAVLGQYHIAVVDVVKSFVSYFSGDTTMDDDMAFNVLWSIRFPRIALGLLVGAALAVAGTLMQAIFSNPLAEPSIIGVSAGASVGASLMIVFAPMALAGFGVPLMAFASGLCAAIVVYLLSMSKGKANGLTLVLTGIAVQAVCTALTSIATYIAPTTARDQIVFWQMGSLSGASWQHVGVVAVVVVIALVCAVAIARQLDILALGDRSASHVGVNVQFFRFVAIILSSLLTAAAVSYAGIIAFVGLIVPHVLRLVMGPLNRYMLPASMLGGALLVTVADLAARTLIPFADL